MPRRKGKPMPSYFASNEEMEACLFCRRNNIRISPMGIQGEKPNISPKIYDRKNIWPEYYKMCKYYYDKYRK
jgi:hypothetical protein